MKEKLITILFAVPQILVLVLLYYLLAINPPHFLIIVIRFLVFFFLILALFVYGYVKIKDGFKRFIKNVLKEGIDAKT